MGHWTLDDIRWDEFDRSKLDPDLVRIVKAACMVEHHGADYGKYLCSVFHDDPEFQVAATAWAEEEVQHGRALRRYAELADPDFDFDHAFGRFVEGHVLALDATESVRGSRCGELIARCMVEVGTSSYYSALRDSAREPVLKEMCRRIAGDEFRHYKLFYTHLTHYRGIERPNLLTRLRVGLGRLAESGDDELAYAYYCGSNAREPYDRRRFSRAYARHTLPLYRYRHVEHGLRMVLRAVGIRPRSRVGRVAIRGAWWIMRSRARRLARAAA